MSFTIKYFIFVSFIFHHSFCESDINLIVKDFFKLQNLRDGILLSCQTPKQSVEALQLLSASGIKMTTLKVDNYFTLKPTTFKSEYTKTAIFIDLRCEESKNLLTNISSWKLQNIKIFKNTYNWLLIHNKSPHEIADYLSGLNINIDAELYYAQYKSIFKYTIYEVYNNGFGNFGHLFINEIGFWYKSSGFELKNLGYKYVRRSNMTGVVLKCMIVVTNKIKVPLQEYVTAQTDTHIDSMNRFNYALLLHLKDIYNYSYEMKRTNSWGYSHNGSFDGMVGELERKQVDIGGSPIFFRLERYKVIDYTIQTWVSRPCFMFRHPKQRSSVAKIYVRPFDSDVWYCVIVVALLVAMGLYILVKCQNRVLKSLEEVSCTFAWFYTMVTIFQQGLPYSLMLTSGKMIVLTISVFSLLIYQYYSASIVSSLLMEAPKSIKTLEDLFKSNLKVAVEDIAYNKDFLVKTNIPLIIQFRDKKIKNNFLHPDAGLKLVKKGGYAFHVDIATAYKIIRETFTEKEVCELSEIQLFPPQKMVAIVQKESPYRKLLTYGLRRIAQSGLMNRQRSIWHERKPPCVKNPNQIMFSVAFTEFSPALVVLLAGMITSLIILLIEMQLKLRKCL